jgi:hypothetical protein
MHKWVDRWTKDKVWMSESDLKVQFDKEMYKERHAFNEKQFKLRMQQGHDVLPAYYLARKDEFKQYSLVQTERMINAVIDETAGTESGRITSLNPKKAAAA